MATTGDFETGFQRRDVLSPRLNWDVLHHICDSLTEGSDILSLSCTCSTLRTGAIQRFLSVCPIILKDERSIRHIYNLVIADKAQRAPHMRALEIRIWNIARTPFESRYVVPDHLLFILACADNLESLTIRQLEQVENFFVTLNLGLLPALWSFTSLRSLSVSGCDGNKAAEFIRHIPSPLKTLRVSLDEANSPYTLDWLAYLAAPFSSTLETIDLYGADLEAASVVSRIPLPALRSFKAHGLSGLPRIIGFLSIFPGLEDALVLTDLDAEVDDEIGRLYLQQHREENKKTQEMSSWNRLDRLVCDAITFFALALKCPIRHVTIHRCSLDTKDDITTSLRENSPPHLTLFIDLWPPDGLSVFDGLFPIELTDTPTHLCLVLRCHLHVDAWSSNVFHFEALLNAIAPSIAHLRLKCLRLILERNLYGFQDTPITVWESCVRAIPEVPFWHMASMLAARLGPALEYVFLTAVGDSVLYKIYAQSWRTSKAFQVARLKDDGDSSGGVDLVELSQEVTGAVLSQEDLFCSIDNQEYHE